MNRRRKCVKRDIARAAVCVLHVNGEFLNDACLFLLVNLTFMEPYIARCLFYITNEMQLIQCSLLLSVLYMFRAVFPPIIRSL